MTRTTLKTPREGLDHRTVPMRLWRKAKKLGTWDPAAIDFGQDADHWSTLSENEQDLLLRLSAQFQGGEESVTYDLLPFLQWMAEQERIEDEMFLTAYLWEEAKHVEGFDRFLREVTQTTGSLEHYYTEAYRTLFLETLPTSLQRLRTDPAPTAVAEAGVTYQMIVEGVLAETGYEAYASTLEAHALLPGMQTFVRKVQQDEARHIAYGVYLLSRLVAAHGDAVWDVIEDRMNALLPLVVDHIQATLAPYGASIPFGVQAEDFVDYGVRQFQKRLQRIEKARAQTVEDVLYG